MNVPVYAFHITHQASGSQFLFDLGCRKDWWNLVPQTVDLLEGSWPGIKVDKDVKEILTENGVTFAGDGMDGISKVILSHSHFDHVGELSTLPKDVEIVVGPGFKKAMMPGYPTNAESTFHEQELTGRNIFEVPFDSNTKLGKFESYDLLGDGTVQILNSPGHAVGHICALVRTTEDSYLLLGGDTCHFVGMLNERSIKNDSCNRLTQRRSDETIRTLAYARSSTRYNRARQTCPITMSMCYLRGVPS